MTETIHQPNGLSDSTSVPPAAAPIPPEIESTLSRLSAYRSVKGVMILSRTPSPSAAIGQGSSSTGAGTGLGGIVQCTGSIFEEESGQRYATMVEALVAAAAKGVGECDQGVSSVHANSPRGCQADGDRTS
jgi:dynein light chain roadblock-type